MMSIPLNSLPPLYDRTLSFEENAEKPPLAADVLPTLPRLPTHTTTRFFDYMLNTAIGAAPCAATTSRGIAQLAAMGFDVITYKTIRSRAQKSHPTPNIYYIKGATTLELTKKTLEHPIEANDALSVSLENLTITNSVGLPSLTPEATAQDIETAKNYLQSGQILIVSVYGEAQLGRSLSADFAYTAQLAQEAGADIIELNLSCPNLNNPHTYLYQDLENTKNIIQAVSKTIQCPILVKIGLLFEEKQMQKLLEVCASAGAQGISAINSISMQVVNHANQPIFKGRRFSGVSGNLIRPLALSFIEQLASINQKKHLELKLLGMGGITQAEHFNLFHDAGAEVALSATGMMWNPYLAIQYRERLLSN